MKKLCFLAIAFLCFGIPTLHAQDTASYATHVFKKGKYNMPYRLLLPRDYDVNKKYPLVLFLHGSGERGNDNEAQLVHGSELFLRDSVRTKYPAFVLFPQCPPKKSWSPIAYGPERGQFVFYENAPATDPMTVLKKLLKKIIRTYGVDKNRIYIGGLSMGGMSTFDMVARNPKTFAAAFPICGGAHTGTADKMVVPKWWVFHGEADEVVPPKYSEEMVRALKEKGASVIFSLYPGVQHNSWDNAFAERGLLSWLFAQRLP